MTVSGLITTSMKNMNMNGDAAADMHAVVESFIIGVVKDLVCMSEKDDGGAEQLTWHGTKSDLLELLRVAYDSGEVMTADGVQMAFSEMVRRVFGVLHVSPVTNPYARLQRAEMRKGIRSVSMHQRLEYIAGHEGMERVKETVGGLMVR